MSSMDFSRDGELLVTSNDDENVDLYNVLTGTYSFPFVKCDLLRRTIILHLISLLIRVLFLEQFLERYTCAHLPFFSSHRHQTSIPIKKFGVSLVRFTKSNSNILCASKNDWDRTYPISFSFLRHPLLYFSYFLISFHFLSLFAFAFRIVNSFPLQDDSHHPSHVVVFISLSCFHEEYRTLVFWCINLTHSPRIDSILEHLRELVSALLQRSPRAPHFAFSLHLRWRFHFCEFRWDGSPLGSSCPFLSGIASSFIETKSSVPWL